MRRAGANSAFTLIELVATMLVLGITAAMAAPLALELSRTSRSAMETRRVVGDASGALAHVAALLREAPSLDETAPGENGLATLSETGFQRADGTGVSIAGDTLDLVIGGVRWPLLAGVESFSLRGLEADGLTEASDPADVRRVEIELVSGGVSLASVAALRVAGTAVDLHWTADNIGEVYLNGSLIDADGDWQRARSVSATAREGLNVVAIHARDTGGPAAALLDVELEGARVGTGASWRVSLAAPAGWEAPNFDDSAWDAATDYGPYGVAPWNDRVSGFGDDTTGRWIWSASNESDNEVWLRGSFEIIDGQLVVPGAPGAGSTFTPPEIIAFGGSQDGQYGLPTEFEVLDGGATLRLSGNAWKAIALPYTVTENTIIEFEFASDQEAEIQGVGLSRDLNIDDARAIQVWGQQGWARHRAPAVAAYSSGGGFQRYSIRVGDLDRNYPLGEVADLVLINDDDNREHDDGVLGESRFRHVRVHEGGGPS